MSYAIGTGYYCDVDNGRLIQKKHDAEPKPFAPEMFEAWWKNTAQYTEPSQIYVSAVSEGPDLQSIARTNDLILNSLEWTQSRNWLHVHHMNPKYMFGGWSMGYLHGMMRCYVDGHDFIYKEQDCLAFGPWVDAMFACLEATGAEMLLGQWDHKYGIEQSLTIIKWKFIPEFVSAWFSLTESDRKLKPEKKFNMLKQRFGPRISWLPFGYGRNRPICFEDNAWYAQHFTSEEFDRIGEKALSCQMKVEDG